MTGPSSTTTSATHDAATAAAAAGVTVRDLVGLDPIAEAVALLATIWGRSEHPPVSTELLRAFAHSGNYVTATYLDEQMIGASVAFHEAPAARTMHSHITGVLPEHAGRHIGLAMKLHQRAWALGRGIRTVEWTFDPLIARNAHFNLASLGAVATEYLPNFYGGMHDDINRGDETDRMLVRWRLEQSMVAASARVMPTATSIVEVPADIETMRRTDPDAAGTWRRRVRDELGGAMAAGRPVLGFDRTRGYLIGETTEDA